MSSILDLAISISIADHFSSGISSAISQFKLMENASAEAQKKMEGFKNMAFIGAAAGAVGAAGVAGLEKLAEKAGEVQMQLIQLGGVYGLNIDDSRLREIDKLAQEMSQQTIFSKKENLGISLELAHAGISKEALQKVVPEATYLAEIEVGIGKSSGAHQSAYNFARMAEDAGITNNTERMSKFADEMYRVISITHASSQSLGEAFKYSMPVVKNLGWTEQDNLLASGMAARAGVEGSMAGTHIKDFAERINPFKYLDTKGGQKQLSAMEDAGLLEGVQYDKTGKKITGMTGAALLKDKDSLKSYADMVDILSQKHHDFLKKGSATDWVSQTSEVDIKHIQELAEKQNGKQLTGGDLQWAALMNHIFGEQGQDFAIISSHKEMFTKMKDQLDIQKDLHEQIRIIRESFQGQTHILHGQMESLGLAIGTPIMEVMLPALHLATAAMGHLLKWFDDHPKVTTFIALLAGGVSLFLLIGGAIMIGVAAFGALMTALEVAGVGLGAVALISGGVVLAIAAVAGVAYLIYKNWGPISTFIKNVWEQVKAISLSVWAAIGPTIMDTVNEVWNTIKTAFTTVANFFHQFWPDIKIGFIALWTLISAIVGTHMRAIWIEIKTVGLIIWETIKATWKVVSVVIQVEWELIKDIVKLGWDWVSGIIKIGLKLLQGDWSGAWAAMKEMASALWEDLKVLFKDSWQGIAKIASTWWEASKEWGKNVVTGIIDGIKAEWNNLKNLVGDLWDKYIKEPFTKKGDINSPSREMKKQGNYVTQGLALGIMDQAGLVKTASESLFSAVQVKGTVSGGGGINVNKPSSGNGGFNFNGPLIGEVHQQPGENTEDFAGRVAQKLFRMLDSKSMKANLTMGSAGLQRGY